MGSDHDFHLGIKLIRKIRARKEALEPIFMVQKSF
jgi:hypothetical protein